MALAKLAAREGWQRSWIAEYQIGRLNDLWGKAVTRTRWYGHLSPRHKLPATFESLEEFHHLVPVLRKQELSNNPADFLSSRPTLGKWHFTSGSSGPPSPIYVPDATHHKHLHTQYRFHAVWGIDVFDPKAFLWGHAASFAPGLTGFLARLRQPVEDRLRNRIRLSSYQLGKQQLATYLRRIKSFQPTALYGFSSALYLLAVEAEETGFACESLQLAILTAEPAFSDIVSQVERGLTVRAAIEYGATECGLIAHQWPDGSLRVREDNVFVETLPREDGRYDIVLTVLDNDSFPLIRYAIGDVTDRPIQHPEQGFAILGEIIGREIDLVVGRNGAVVHTAAIAALLKYYDVRRFQIHQQRDGAVTVQLEVANPASFQVTSKLRKQLVDFVEGYSVSISVVEVIPGNTGGKHRWSLSELAHQG